MDTSILEHYKFVREQRSKLEIENDYLKQEIKELKRQKESMNEINRNTRMNLDEQIDNHRKEIKQLKEMVSTTANIGYKFMKKNKKNKKYYEEPSMPTKEECMVEEFNEMVKNDTKPSKELEEWLANGN